MRIDALVINFNTAPLTTRAVESLVHDSSIGRVWVADNGSDASDYEMIAALASERVTTVRLESNYGFAGAAELMIQRLCRDTDADAFLLLNSDAHLVEEVRALSRLLDVGNGTEMVGGRMEKPGGQVDCLGIAMYASGLASNRLDENVPFFGPTGGLALLGRRVCEDLRATHGYVFDDKYFCYAEDTDLVCRARLLGYRAAFHPELSAIHEGQASSSRFGNDFIFHFGIRNSLWTAIKCFPLAFVLRRFPLVLGMLAAIAFKAMLAGNARALVRIVLETASEWPRLRSDRRRIQASRRVSAREFAEATSWRFYEAYYFSVALGGMINRVLRRLRP